MEEFRIYVASLTDYNAGFLHGEWIDLNGKDEDEILEEIQEMLKASPAAKRYNEVAEEWAIHDFELPIDISEHESIENVVRIVDLLEKHGDNAEAFAIYADHIGNIDDAEQHFEDAYCGEWDSFRAYVEETFDSRYEIPDHLVYYIDYEKIARDWEMDHVFISGYVFRDV